VTMEVVPLAMSRVAILLGLELARHQVDWQGCSSQDSVFSSKKLWLATCYEECVRRVKLCQRLFAFRSSDDGRSDRIDYVRVAYLGR
jgi:hypothetical protein